MRLFEGTFGCCSNDIKKELNNLFKIGKKLTYSREKELMKNEILFVNIQKINTISL